MKPSLLQLHKIADHEGKPDEDGRLPLVGVELQRGTEAPKRHGFSEDFVRQAVSDGWASLVRGELILHLIDGDLTYKILEPPGRHDDPDSEAGYRISHEYLCALKGGK